MGETVIDRKMNTAIKAAVLPKCRNWKIHRGTTIIKKP